MISPILLRIQACRPLWKRLIARGCRSNLLKYLQFLAKARVSLFR